MTFDEDAPDFQETLVKLKELARGVLRRRTCWSS